MKRFAVCLILTLTMVAPGYAAANADETSESVSTGTIGVALSAPSLPAVRAEAAAKRPAILPALYGGSAALQAFDVYSTLSSLRAGAREANPFMQTATANPAVFVGLKASVTAASILAAEKMWREHHRVAAVAMMAASNAIMGVVAAHNASVLASVR